EVRLVTAEDVHPPIVHVVSPMMARGHRFADNENPYRGVSTYEEASDVDVPLSEQRTRASAPEHLGDLELRAFERPNHLLRAREVHQQPWRCPVETESHDSIHVACFLHYLAHAIQTIANITENHLSQQVRV